MTFEENMTAVMYQEILATFLIPYMAYHFDTSGIIHQDNDPKHSAQESVRLLSDAGVKWIKAPARSPDLNPIEMLWHAMKQHVRSRYCNNSICEHDYS